ncbi:MAG: GGDEF domain-containing protein [Candidatus Hydrogenedentes bacterium]|nr:GGDEF domain-containing protein [Candidatus Hydrogenedentota bacterium]
MNVDITPNHDALTGMERRPAFEGAFEAMTRDRKLSARGVSVALLDIDLFGQVNEALGQPEGDAVLAALAEALRGQINGSAALYRFGGDAFALLFKGVEKEAAFLWTEQFRSGLSSQHFSFGPGKSLSLSVSAGLAAWPDDGATALEVVQRACEALFRAKATGRDRVCLAREEKMVTRTSHYQQGQLMGLRRLAERKQIGEAVLLREALNDLLRKYNA